MEFSGRKFVTIAVVSTFCMTQIGALILTIMKIMEVTVYLAITATMGTVTIYIIKSYFDDIDRTLPTTSTTTTATKTETATKPTEEPK